MGELLPNTLAISLGDKAYKKAMKAPPLPEPNAQIPKMEKLQKAGYGDVLTPAHLDVNDTRLRAMMDKTPNLAKKYMGRTQNAIEGDFNRSVNPPAAQLGEEATGMLGAEYGGKFEGALKARDKAYSDMM